ncbi:MAG: S1 RNA-binding domain-containing protein [Deferribacteraceae bacterium]|jgi:ribosomal protein S1|nr:S1 RNA-binding domain-containing protein [Deferribacteraceae bacterium]
MSNEHKNEEEMKMEDFESMLEESLKQPTIGSRVKGVIAQIQGDDVIINIGSKTEGIADKNEFPDDLKVGDTLELVVLGFITGGYMRLSRRTVNERSDWNALKDASDKVVNVKIESHTEKGYRGKIGDIDAFIPENHIDLKSRMKDPGYYVGKTFQAKLLKLSGSGKHRSALVSPKEYILDQSNKVKQDFLNKLKVGDVVKGVIKTLKEYGAFVSFGPVDGFLHKSNIRWGRPRNPSKYVEEGQEIEVKILEVNLENGKIEVGLKQLTEDPWSGVSAKYPVDSFVKATLIGRRRNGYIAEAEPGVDVFIPLEELSWLKNARISMNPKDIIEGRVLDYDSEHKRIITSVKMMNENPWKALKKATPEGSVIEGRVKNITNFGIFVDFGQFVDGLIRKGDISWSEEPSDLSVLYKPGDTVEAKVLKIDEARERVSLGVKQVSQNPWKELPKNIAGKAHDVTVTAVTKTGLDVALPSGLKGHIPSTELDPGKSSPENFKAGDVVSATLIKADIKEKSILLSIKKHISDSERKETKEYMEKLKKTDESQGFGAIFKDKLK